MYYNFQVQFLVDQPTLMKGLDQSYLPAFSAMGQKLDYGTVPTHKKILVPILLMLVLHVLVGHSQLHLAVLN